MRVFEASWYARISNDLEKYIILTNGMFNLDLSTRRGLRQVNKDFNKINGALDRLYAQHKDDDRVAGAIVGIYAKMCVDAVLRNRLFDEGKFLYPLS